MSQRDLSGINGISKQVTIEIDVGDLGTLKAGSYSLCIAKKVEGGYGVVWDASRQFIHTNRISWKSEFELFGAHRFVDGIGVTPGTNRQPVRLGEQCVLDANGRLGRASPGGPATEITLVNQYGPIHAGLSQLLDGIGGGQRMLPIHVAPRASAMGQVGLTPTDSVLVWFEQNISTATMFSKPRPKAVEIDLSRTNAATLLYRNGTWSVPG